MISIIGPSGTGKSTLMRCISLLEKPTAGRVCIDGVEITNPIKDELSVAVLKGIISNFNYERTESESYPNRIVFEIDK